MVENQKYQKRELRRNVILNPIPEGPVISDEPRFKMPKISKMVKEAVIVGAIYSALYPFALFGSCIKTGVERAQDKTKSQIEEEISFHEDRLNKIPVLSTATEFLSTYVGKPARNLGYLIFGEGE